MVIRDNEGSKAVGVSEEGTETVKQMEHKEQLEYTPGALRIQPGRNLRQWLPLSSGRRFEFFGEARM